MSPQNEFLLVFSVSLISLFLFHSISADDEDRSLPTEAEALDGLLKTAAGEKTSQATPSTASVLEGEQDYQPMRGDCHQSETHSNGDLLVGYALPNETVIGEALDQDTVCAEHEHCEHEEQPMERNEGKISKQQQEDDVRVRELSQGTEVSQELSPSDEVKQLEKYNTLVKWVEESGGFMRYHSFKYMPGAGVGVIASENIEVY